MSAPELHSGLALRCTPALGVEGAKVYLQVKGLRQLFANRIDFLPATPTHLTYRGCSLQTK